MSIAVLIMLIIHVESGGDKYALNTSNGAAGPMQIKPILLKDYNDANGTSYVMADLFSYGLSVTIFEWTIDRYATFKNLGYEPGFRDYAGVWRSGLKGYKRNRHESDEYWNLIMIKRGALGL